MTSTYEEDVVVNTKMMTNKLLQHLFTSDHILSYGEYLKRIEYGEYLKPNECTNNIIVVEVKKWTTYLL